MTRSKLTHVEIGPGMTQEQAETLYARGRETAVFVMMVVAKKLAVETATSTDAPATPSAAKPPCEKENKQADKQGQKKSGNKPGAKPGHSGKHREQPERINRHEQLRAKECPDCGNKRLLSEGGLVKIWHRLAAVLEPWHEKIKREALDAAVLHGDETGWRVHGKTHWLWCFASQDATFYLIDRSGGSPAIGEFFTEFFNRVLVTDFWAAYNTVACAWRQMCLVHWLRELKKVDKYLDSSNDWGEFRKKLKRLVLDAIRLWQRREEYSEETYASRRSRIIGRPDTLIADDWANKNATRLVKRLRKYHDHLFTFLDLPYVPFENNFAEREIRPAVIMRKNSYCNRSDKGADTQAILMTVFRTLNGRNLNPVDTVVQALRQYNLTGILPPLPSKKT